MDQTRFDAFARTLATTETRRRVLGGLAAGALALFGTSKAEAATCREVGVTCTKDAQCCGGVCGEKDTRGRRRCDCPEGYRLVDGECVPLLANGEPCTASDQCRGGACACRSLSCEEAICGTHNEFCTGSFFATPEGTSLAVCTGFADYYFDCTTEPCPEPLDICRSDIVCFPITL